MPDQQTPRNALDLVDQALASVAADRNTHIQLQASVLTLRKFVADHTSVKDDAVVDLKVASK